MGITPKEFWEKKILAWEVGRYSRPEQRVGLVEWIANRASMSLRFRLNITPKLLQPYIFDKRVVEVGCGSGLIARALVDAGAATYLGVDIAESSILRARERDENGDSRIRFLCGGLEAVTPGTADIVLSLGLLDWLSDAEIEVLFRRSGDAEFLHAISETRPGFQQSLHRLYLRLTYGGGTTYRPRYFKASQIAMLAARSVAKPMYVYRDPRLSFGALISSLPIGPLV